MARDHRVAVREAAVDPASPRGGQRRVRARVTTGDGQVAVTLDGCGRCAQPSIRSQ